MAKKIASYRGYIIKETNAKDYAMDTYWVIKPSWSTVEYVWGSDRIEDCKEFIDGDKQDDIDEALLMKQSK